jgi:nucleoside-diphosphate-sugar epimerase
MSDARVLILGCGDLGALVAERLLAGGQACFGVRRSPGQAPCPLLLADGAEPSAWSAIVAGAPIAAVLLAANPGLRGGGDGNRVAAMAALLHRHLPAARVVYTGSTGIYGDANGAYVDESGPLATDPRAAGLAAIEAAVLRHPRALVLRVAGITGPGRTRSLERLRAGGPIVVEGDPQRPFSIIDERDLADICVRALGGALGTGILNCASPERLSVADYYRAIARRAGLPEPDICSDRRSVARRGIDVRSLLAHVPAHPWRPVGAA